MWYLTSFLYSSGLHNPKKCFNNFNHIKMFKCSLDLPLSVYANHILLSSAFIESVISFSFFRVMGTFWKFARIGKQLCVDFNIYIF